jgi:hypothetical protein
MKKLTLITTLLAVMLPVVIWAQCNGCDKSDDKVMKIEKSAAAALPGYNKAVNLPDGKYFTYNFDKKPKMGTSILQVHVYDKKGRYTDDYEVYVVADMPSMKGAHASGDVKMKANKKGVMLSPVNFVMPGVWEVELKFVKDGKRAYHAAFELKI